ncbi:MAG: division/cell wall cluster transcriptional repressor MraZ [Acidobacteria bacterium]|nr:division/cell wall cluster transcriptional repressor MraZ [Acidobacteriota bacterium]
MLIGNQPAKIDAKGRIKIPASFRKYVADKYGNDLYITSLTGDSVLIYPLPEWIGVTQKLEAPPRLLPEKQKYLRITNYYGQLGTMDAQGRVVIQPHLRERAQMNGEVVAVMGHLTYLEVWNNEKFSQLLHAHPFTDEDAEKLAGLGL